MKIVAACVFCLMVSTPAFAQKSEERQQKERAATIFLIAGISTAVTGLTTMSYPSIGLPFTAAGGAMIFYATRLNSQAKQMPAIGFTVVPVKKGVAFGVARTW